MYHVLNKILFYKNFQLRLIDITQLIPAKHYCMSLVTLTYLFTHLLTYSLTYLLTYSLTHSLSYLLSYSLTYSLVYFLIYLLSYLLTLLLTSLLTLLLTYLITYLFPCLMASVRRETSKHYVHNWALDIVLTIEWTGYIVRNVSDELTAVCA